MKSFILVFIIMLVAFLVVGLAAREFGQRLHDAAEQALTR